MWKASRACWSTSWWSRSSPTQASDEYYLAIRSGRDGDEILFHHEGGVDVRDGGFQGLWYTADTLALLNLDDFANSHPATILFSETMVEVDEA